jgi:serine/threonine-protein kinase
MLTFACPACTGKLTARDQLAGRKAKCPRCGHPVQIPRVPVSSRETLPDTADTGTPVPRSGGGRKTGTPTRPQTQRWVVKLEHSTPLANQPDMPSWPVVPGYEILGVLGKGGMGIVYKARQKNLDRPVAIKMVLVGQLSDASSVARFEKEALTVAKLCHPNIVMPYDFGRYEGQLFLVMEFLEGETVETRVARQGPLDEATAWGMIRQAAAGLAHAGQVGVVHRDVKPSNLILVDPPAGSLLPAGLPMVKITDFGLAILADGASSRHLSWAALGTPMYMAPEQFSDAVIDCRADIYALGASVYHMLTGQPPFPGANVWEIMIGKNNEDFPDINALDNKVSDESIELLTAMIARDRDTRISNYAELLERIDRLAVIRSGFRFDPSLAPAAPPKARPRRWTWRWPPRRRHLTVVMPLVALALLLVGWTLALTSASNRTSIAPLVTTGHGLPLFDGTTLNGWAVDEGAWYPARDSEGGRVLSGQGIIRRRLPSLDQFRVTLSIDLGQAAAAEVHFAIAPTPAPGGSRLVLRVTSQGVVLARRPADRGELDVLSSAKPFMRSADPGRESPYRELQIERQSRQWLAFFNGELVGSSPATAEPELEELRLVIQGGPAFFESLEVAELGPSQP